MAAIIGAAQGPSLQWKPNPDGPRTIEQAVEIARRHGVAIPQDVEFFLDADGSLPEEVYARYFDRMFLADETIHWREFYNRDNVIPVLVRPAVLSSDEAIVAIFTHEMHELNRLREIFAGTKRKQITFVLLDELVRPGVKRNLHDEAWDKADEAVRNMRGESV